MISVAERPELLHSPLRFAINLIGGERNLRRGPGQTQEASAAAIISARMTLLRARVYGSLLYCDADKAVLRQFAFE